MIDFQHNAPLLVNHLPGSLSDGLYRRFREGRAISRGPRQCEQLSLLGGFDLANIQIRDSLGPVRDHFS